MNLYGGMAKGERNRIKIRVRSAMLAQARHEGRFLGGRPPYGYQLVDVGPHPNPSKAADGRRLHRLDLDLAASPVVVRIFNEYLSGRGIYAIAEGLTRDGILSPSAHDPVRNPHRRTSKGAWAKAAIGAILRNPRYTGYEVWNKQRRDEVLIDVDDVALGNTSKMRWNPSDQWVTSEEKAHPAIIEPEVFDRVREHPYLLRGMLICGLCGRRMQGSWNNRTLNYRCRFASEYAMTEAISHPLNVYVRQDAIEPLLDQWLIGVFDADNVQETCVSLAAANCAMSDGDLAREKAARLTLTDCDRRLSRYRQVLDEGVIRPRSPDGSLKSKRIDLLPRRPWLSAVPASPSQRPICAS
jgi:hypothetical protein